MVAKRKPEPIRKRLTIPAINESVLAWFELQDDASASVRLLIQESIQRNGYVDIINRPVGQLPRRGRPPADGSRSTGRSIEEEDRPLGETDDVPWDEVESGDATISRADDELEEQVPQERAQTTSTAEQVEPEKPADSPATTTTKNNTTAAEPELEDIFGSMRD